ncbi:hypothetical protein ACFE04_014504 [Oxalis oulophora]
MCALSSPFLNYQWPLGSELDPISNHHHQLEQINNYKPLLFDQELAVPPLEQRQAQLDHSASFSTGNSCDPNTVKKLTHNASERDRRKKMNSLYLSLRSLLPQEDQLKRLSIPATVSCVLKYIPDLEREVERLIRKKEEIESKISKQDDLQRRKNNNTYNNLVSSSFSTVSTSKLTKNQIVVQISISKVNQTPLSKILTELQGDGLFLINASSTVSSQDMVFYNLHLQDKRG